MLRHTGWTFSAYAQNKHLIWVFWRIFFFENTVFSPQISLILEHIFFLDFFLRCNFFRRTNQSFVLISSVHCGFSTFDFNFLFYQFFTASSSETSSFVWHSDVEFISLFSVGAPLFQLQRKMKTIMYLSDFIFKKLLNLERKKTGHGQLHRMIKRAYCFYVGAWIRVRRLLESFIHFQSQTALNAQCA